MTRFLVAGAIAGLAIACQRGGIVAGGAWVIALREKDVGPGDVGWRFILDDGIVRAGAGIFPLDA